MGETESEVQPASYSRSGRDQISDISLPKHLLPGTSDVAGALGAQLKEEVPGNKSS
jgi:hypothetical protein